jgi:FKBP-type peptidyl-prolyl cis-trans isomerase SlyD
VQLEPEHAFGDYRPELVCFEDRKLFPETLETGMTFEGLPPGSATPDMPADAIYVVTDVFPSHVVLDGNHPLAGMALRLTVTIQDVREASREELEARSVGDAPLTVLGSGHAPGGAAPLH